MTHKLRSDSTLARLSEDQLDELFTWLNEGTSYPDVIKRARLPAPEGFSIEFHKNTLVRFFRAERIARQEQELAESLALNISACDPALVLNALKVHLAHDCYGAIAGPLDNETRNQLSRVLNRFENGALKREKLTLKQQTVELDRLRLDLDRERHREQIRQFELDAAALAAQHAVELKTIINHPTLTNLQKGEHVRPILFPASSITTATDPDAVPTNQ